MRAEFSLMTGQEKSDCTRAAREYYVGGKQCGYVCRPEGVAEG